MIYIVRHGKTEWNKLGLTQGRSDTVLNEDGRDEALVTKEKLKDIKFDIVFSSPLKRAYETAKIITDDKIIVDERIIERGNGDLEGKHFIEFKDIDFASDDCCEKYKIEKLDVFSDRIYDFLDELHEKHKDKNILVVTHAGVSINIKIYFEGAPVDGDVSGYMMKNCEVRVYEFKKEGFGNEKN